MADIRIENLTKRFDSFMAIDNVSLTIEDQEFTVLLGPSGCGKTTLLRAIAGLGMADAGRISIGGRDVTYLPARERKISMVFQSYAIFPHMKVYDNVAFGLKMNKFDQQEIDKRVREAAELLHIENMLDRYPGKLSGGQRQRVAVARAIAMRSEVLLMDEPLSNLDALLRLEMRAELKRLLQEIKTTTIYVTHDQIEAMSMGDRIVVMKDGVVQQVDAPLSLYNKPVNRFVAGFIGSPTMNFFTGIIANDGTLLFQEDATSFRLPLPETHQRYQSWLGRKIVLGIRPEHILQTTNRGAPGIVPVAVMIEVIEPVGNEVFVYFSTGSAQNFVARVPSDAPPSAQTRCDLFFDMTKAHFFDSESGVVITAET